MTTIQTACAAMAAVLLAGCAELKALDDKAMNHVLEQRGQTGQLQPEPWALQTDVPPEAECKFSGLYRQIQNCCIMKRYTTSLDVDTAYAKAMQEYGFSVTRPSGEGANNPHYHGHDYQAQPAALYRMFGEVTPRSDVRLSRGVWMGFVIAKAGPNIAEIEPVYCEMRGRRMKDQLTWHKAVQDNVRATLPPLQPQRK